MKRIFVTGGGGFVGFRLVARLSGEGWSVVALDRSGSLKKRLNADGIDRVEVVSGDLLAPGAYLEALRGADVVAHLAAMTGKGTRDEHHRSNVTGTETLLRACSEAGVGRFLFTSSIAAGFPPETTYHYAAAKRRAEKCVRDSGLEFVIVRPTMILGAGSPIQAMLEKLATLPVIPVPGNGKTLVQPISVDDVVGFLLTILDWEVFSGETFEIGGRDVVTMEELLRRIRERLAGGRGLALHVPIGVISLPLAVMEFLGLGRLLPVSAGQMSSFRFDGRISSNRLYDEARERLRSLESILAGRAAA